MGPTPDWPGQVSLHGRGCLLLGRHSFWGPGPQLGLPRLAGGSWQRGEGPCNPLTTSCPCRKRQLSPQSKSSSKVTSVPGKASDAGATTATGTKSGKASTLSRREELLKQLKAVEDAIARKRAKIPGKV